MANINNKNGTTHIAYADKLHNKYKSEYDNAYNACCVYTGSNHCHIICVKIYDDKSYEYYQEQSDNEHDTLMTTTPSGTINLIYKLTKSQIIEIDKLNITEIKSLFKKNIDIMYNDKRVIMCDVSNKYESNLEDVSYLPSFIFNEIKSKYDKPIDNTFINKTIKYIYLVQLREHFNTGKSIAKIGQSVQENNGRLSGYPKGSIILFQETCIDCINLEKELINLFKENYTHRKDLGNEYFEGNIVEMKDYIHETVLNEYKRYYKNVNNTKKEIKVEKYTYSNFKNNYDEFSEDYEYMCKILNNNRPFENIITLDQMNECMRNIKINNMNDKYIDIYNGKKWLKEDMNVAITNYLTAKLEDINYSISTLKLFMSNESLEYYKEPLIINKKVIARCKLMIYNGIDESILLNDDTVLYTDYKLKHVKYIVRLMTENGISIKTNYHIIYKKMIRVKWDKYKIKKTYIDRQNALSYYYSSGKVNSIQDFIEDCLEFTKNKKDKIKTSKLYEVFSVYDSSTKISNIMFGKNIRNRQIFTFVYPLHVEHCTGVKFKSDKDIKNVMDKETYEAVMLKISN
jgi:hypothetical protein